MKSIKEIQLASKITLIIQMQMQFKISNMQNIKATRTRVIKSKLRVSNTNFPKMT